MQDAIRTAFVAHCRRSAVAFFDIPGTISFHTTAVAGTIILFWSLMSVPKGFYIQPFWDLIIS